MNWNDFGMMYWCILSNNEQGVINETTQVWSSSSDGKPSSIIEIPKLYSLLSQSSNKGKVVDFVDYVILQDVCEPNEDGNTMEDEDYDKNTKYVINGGSVEKAHITSNNYYQPNIQRKEEKYLMEIAIWTNLL